MENAKEERSIEMVIAREGRCMKVKNEVRKKGERVRWMARSLSHAGSSVPMPASEINFHIRNSGVILAVHCSPVIAAL